MTAERCKSQRCKKRAEIEGLCVSHAERLADARFSWAVRYRDARCTAAGVLNGDCNGGLQAAHIVGRRNHSLRYDPRNVHALCQRHHMTVDQHGQEGAKYRWAVSILGEDGYDQLMFDAIAITDRRESIREALA